MAPLGTQETAEAAATRPSIAAAAMPTAAPLIAAQVTEAALGCSECDCQGMVGKQARFCARCGHAAPSHNRPTGPPAPVAVESAPLQAPPPDQYATDPPAATNKPAAPTIVLEPEPSDTSPPIVEPAIASAQQPPAPAVNQTAAEPTPNAEAPPLPIDAHRPSGELNETPSDAPPASADDRVPEDATAWEISAAPDDEEPTMAGTRSLGPSSSLPEDSVIRGRDPRRIAAPILDDRAEVVPSTPPGSARNWRAIRIGSLVVLAVGLGVLAAIAAYVLATGNDTTSPKPAQTVPSSAKPPAFDPHIGLTLRIPSSAGLIATPAGDGGLWYQTNRSNLTRLSADTGKASYAFNGTPHSAGLQLTGRSLSVLRAGQSHSLLISRDRGNGHVTQSVRLPAAPTCTTASAGECGPIQAGAALWVSLETGLARIAGQPGRVTVQRMPPIRAMASGDQQLWVLTNNAVSQIDTQSGQVTRRHQLPTDLRAERIAVGAGAVWAIGDKAGRPVIVRIDPTSGDLHTVPLPAPATSIVVEDRAVWVSMGDAGIQELDPSANKLAGSPQTLSGAANLLPAGNDRLWVVRSRGNASVLTRLDLNPRSG